VNAVLPFNVALGSVGTLIQLLILNLHGTVIDVGLAITLFNAVSVPAAIIWGFVTDRFHRRKPIQTIHISPSISVLVNYVYRFVWVVVICCCDPRDHKRAFRNLVGARMGVPKMVKNGYKSVLCVRVTCWRLFSEWKLETSANTKMGIKTIFDQFRNKHTR
jgi:hypothetical protein